MTKTTFTQTRWSLDDLFPAIDSPDPGPAGFSGNRFFPRGPASPAEPGTACGSGRQLQPRGDGCGGSQAPSLREILAAALREWP